jgi:hypothetical protein
MMTMPELTSFVVGILFGAAVSAFLFRSVCGQCRSHLDAIDKDKNIKPPAGE